MSVDRAPIKRPSVSGIVGDNAGRVRGIEAGQTMPYCYGSYYYQWDADTVPDGFGANTTTSLTIRLFPEIAIGGSGDYTTFDTTDNSILSNVSMGGSDDGGCIFVGGGGLFYWEAQLQCGFPWLGESFFYPVTSVLIPPYAVAGDDDPRQLTGPIFGATNFASLQTRVQGGTFSVDGTLFGFLDDESQAPIWPNQIVSTVDKCDAGDAGFVQLSIMCARWTPVGFSHWGGE